MSNLPILRPDDLNDEQKRLWTNIVEGPRGARMRKPVEMLPGPFNAWLQIPSFGERAAAMGERLQMGSLLPGKLRELAILVVGVHWKAEFEVWVHANIAREAGLSEALIEALKNGTPPEYADDNERLVHSAAQELVSSGRLSPELIEGLESTLGWPMTVELVALVGFYCMVCLTLNAFEVGLPEGVAPVWPI